MNTCMMQPGLLVSVRSAAEALDALTGGADVIDVKEPNRGPLGQANPDVIQEVIATVAGRALVSVALGELVEWTATPIPRGVTFVKWGLANLTTQVEVVVSALRARAGVEQPVLVAYADYQRAGSPEPQFLAELARQFRFPVLLLDTAVKDGSTLLDWMPVRILKRIRSSLAAVGVRIAMAGSLGARQIECLASLAPDWFAVRGAACEGGRGGRVNARRVREIRQLISAVAR